MPFGCIYQVKGLNQFKKYKTNKFILDSKIEMKKRCDGRFNEFNIFK